MLLESLLLRFRQHNLLALRPLRFPLFPRRGGSVTVPNSRSPPQRPTSTAQQSALIRHRCLRTTHIYMVHSHVHSNTLSSSTSKVLVAPATGSHPRSAVFFSIARRYTNTTPRREQDGVVWRPSEQGTQNQTQPRSAWVLGQ
jgi:hypothetical protein